MTALEQLRDSIPDYARDLKLNLGSVLTVQGAPGLTANQIWGTALATAIASRHLPLVQAIETAARAEIDEAGINGAKAAAAIMGMNNVYYRFLHLVGDAEYQSMPARLRMSVMANPGIDKLDFELYSLAVSAVNGCGLCIESHEKLLRKHDIGRDSIQSTVRIAAVVHAVACVLEQGLAEQSAELAA
ncbi:MAG: alkyl hydroperoxide reductase [Gammaproteobacteria bacterium]|nr:alkyl hydroperoxide reductase [Gammaproteobacteria bacterium]